MKANPVLKKLGLADSDRVVIFHADDIGMFQSTVSAYADLIDFGLLSSAAVMVPCPRFAHAADYCRNNQDNKAVDMGVHLTITSEWQAYRWGPVSTRDPNSGLMDSSGYFFDTSEAVWEHGSIDAVSQELRAQIDFALATGIDVTHIDSHMGALFHPKFVDAYLELASEYKLPALYIRQDVAGLRQLGVDAETATYLTLRVSSLEAKGIPLIDNLYMMPLDQSKSRQKQGKQVLDQLPSGIICVLIHPVKDTPELRTAAWTEDWPNRVADYQPFIDEELRDYVQQSDIHLIGYRSLRELMRKELA